MESKKRTHDQISNPLNAAILKRDWEDFQRAIGEGYQPDSETLNLAIMSEDIDMITGVYNLGAQPNQDTLNCILVTNNKKAFDLIVQQKITLQPNQDTPACANLSSFKDEVYSHFKNLIVESTPGSEKTALASLQDKYGTPPGYNAAKQRRLNEQIEEAESNPIGKMFFPLSANHFSKKYLEVVGKLVLSRTHSPQKDLDPEQYQRIGDYFINRLSGKNETYDPVALTQLISQIYPDKTKTINEIDFNPANETDEVSGYYHDMRLMSDAVKMMYPENVTTELNGFSEDEDIEFGHALNRKLRALKICSAELTQTPSFFAPRGLGLFPSQQTIPTTEEKMDYSLIKGELVEDLIDLDNLQDSKTQGLRKLGRKEFDKLTLDEIALLKRTVSLLQDGTFSKGYDKASLIAAVEKKHAEFNPSQLTSNLVYSQRK